MMRAGEDLSNVVASYVNSLEFARRGLLRSNAASELAITEVEGVRIYSALDDASVGKYVRAGNYEREVTAVFHRFLRKDMHVVDVGANIGYFSLLSAKLVGADGHVTAVEPNPRNVRLLEASCRANGLANLTILQMAAGRETGLLSLNTSHSNGTTSDLMDGTEAALDSELVMCFPLDSALASAPAVDFIKVDVEGAEYNALFGCRKIIGRDRPVIVSEFSPNLMPGISAISGEGYIHWLTGIGYSIAIIEPDGSLSPAGKDASIVLGHYATRGIDHIDIVATPD